MKEKVYPTIEGHPLPPPVYSGAGAYPLRRMSNYSEGNLSLKQLLETEHTTLMFLIASGDLN
jgi:hypothetical protein